MKPRLQDRNPGSLCRECVGVALPSGMSAQTTEVWDSIGRATENPCKVALSARYVQSVTRLLHRNTCWCAGDGEYEEVDSQKAEGAGPVSALFR